MRKFSILILAILGYETYAQSNKSQKFNIGVGAEYRVTPFNFKNSPTYSQNIVYNRDKQLSGFSFLLSIDYEVIKGFKVGVGQSLRYDEKYYSETDKKVEKGMIYDTHLKIKYFFDIKNQHFNAFLGYSFMNNNTTYNDIKVFQYDTNGNPSTYSYGDNDFKFNAYNLGIGYNYKEFNFVIGTYITSKEHNFSNFGTSSIGMPYLQINYNIFKF